MKYLPTQTGDEDDSETLREYAEWRFKKNDSEDFSEWLEKEAKNDPALKKYFIATKNTPQSSIIMDSEEVDSDKVSKKGTSDSSTKANDDFTSGMTLKEAIEARREKERQKLRAFLYAKHLKEKEAAEKTRTIEEKILDVGDKEDTELTENINEVLRWRFEKSESKDYSEWLENEAKHDPVVKQHLLTTNVLLVTEEGALIAQSPSSEPSKIEPPTLLEGIVLFLVSLIFLPMSFIIGLLFPDLLSIVIIISVIISIIIIILAFGNVPLEHVIISLCYIWFCVFIFYSGANTCIMFCEGQEVLLPFPDG